MASFLKARAIPGIEVVSADRYARTIEIKGVHGVVAVEPAGGNALRVAIRFPQLPALPTIIARLRRVFDLGADPQAIGAHLAEDPILAPLIAARPGLRVPGRGMDSSSRSGRCSASRSPSPPPSAWRQNWWRATASLWRAPASRRDGLTHVFPRPERLASADQTSLGDAADAGRGARVAGGGRRGRSAGPWRRTKPDGCVSQLRALPGIGEWTAQYIAMRELREPDAFPAGDIGLLRAMADRMGRGRRLASCSRTRSAGGRGAPTRRSTCGQVVHRPPRRRLLRTSGNGPALVGGSSREAAL